MADHPVHAVLVDGVAVNKGALRSHLKGYIYDFGTAANFRTFDLGALVPKAIISNALYYFDAADLVSADDGATIIIDNAGNRYRKVPVSVAGETVFRATAVAGTADAPELTIPGFPILTATPVLVLAVLAANNTGAMTIKYGAQPVGPLLSPAGAALAADEVMGGRPYLISATSTESRIYMSGVTW